VDETGTHALAAEPFHVAARFAEAEAADGRFAEPERPADQMIERHVASCHVAPGLRGVEGQRVVSGQRLEGFGFDQGDLAVRPLPARVGASPQKVPISLEAAARNRPNRVDPIHPGARDGRNVERHHPSRRHRGAV
jgi:hypothetical protein